MSKVMTAVYLVFLISTIFVGSYVVANDNPATSSGGTTATQDTTTQFCRDKYYDKDKKGDYVLATGKTRAEYEACLTDERKNFLGAIGQNNPIDKQRCDKLSEEFRNVAKDLRTNCEKTGAAKSLDTCYNSIAGCQEVEADDHEAVVGSNGDLYFNSEDGCDMINKCPAKAAAHMKDWKKTASEGEDKLTKLNNDKLDAERDQAELVSKTARDMQRIQREIQDISNKEQELMSRIPEIVAAMDLQTRTELTKLRDGLAQLDFEMDRATFAQNKAMTEYQNLIGTIEAKCKADGRAKFDAATAASTGNEGGLNNLLSSQPRANRVIDRIVNYECTQPSVVEAKAAAQRNLNDRLAEAQTAFTKYKNLSDVQRRSSESIYQQFESQKQAAVTKSKDQARELNTRKTQLMSDLAILAQETQSRTALAQKRSADAQERSHRIQQNMALSMSNLKCSKSLTPSEEANARSVIGFSAEFDNTANTFCKAELACRKYGGVGQDFLKSVKGKEIELARAGNCEGLYKDDKIEKSSGLINDRKPAAKTD